MATAKKKTVKVRDLKPAKDAKGGVARQNLASQSAGRPVAQHAANRSSQNRMGQ